MKTIMYNGHKLEIKGLGREKVYYDGQEMSSRLSMFGASHVFRVKEAGEDVQYEVIFGTRWHGCSYWCEVRRKGEIIYTDR